MQNVHPGTVEMGKKVCVSSLLQAATLNDESKGDLHQILDIKPDPDTVDPSDEGCSVEEASIREGVYVQGTGAQSKLRMTITRWV